MAKRNEALLGPQLVWCDLRATPVVWGVVLITTLALHQPPIPPA